MQSNFRRAWLGCDCPLPFSLLATAQSAFRKTKAEWEFLKDGKLRVKQVIADFEVLDDDTFKLAETPALIGFTTGLARWISPSAVNHSASITITTPSS